MSNQKPEEHWQPIMGYKNYEISNRGRIRSVNRKVWHKGSEVHMTLKGKLMRQRWNRTCKCYFLDLISDEGKRTTVYPHRETAKAFVPNENPDAFKMIIHIDNNPRNNHAGNLQWMSKSDHMKWQFDKGNKNNFKVWKTRKKLYKNGFKPDTVLPGRPKKVRELTIS